MTDLALRYTVINSSQANYLRGGVRPMSAMIPMLAIPAVSKCGFYILPVVSATNLSLSGELFFCYERVFYN